jgi:hypothetical protein
MPTQLRSVEITSRAAVTLSIQLCGTAHGDIQATAFPVHDVPQSYSGVLRLLSANAETQAYAEFQAGSQLWCSSMMGVGTTNSYALLTPADEVSLLVTNFRRPGQQVYDVTIPFGATYNPNAGSNSCSSPRLYNYVVTNGDPAGAGFSSDDYILSGTIRMSIKPTEPLTSSTSVVTICGITVS